MSLVTEKDGSPPLEGDCGSCIVKLLNGSESAATVGVAPRVATAAGAMAAPGDMRTECDNRASHNNQRRRRTRRQRQSSYYLSGSVAAAAATATSATSRHEEGEKSSGRTNQQQQRNDRSSSSAYQPGELFGANSKIQASSSIQSSDKLSLYSPLRARLAVSTLERGNWSSLAAAAATTSDYYSSSHSSPLSQIRSATFYCPPSARHKTISAPAVATKIYENPFHNKHRQQQQQQQDDDATRMMINSAANNSARQQSSAASAPNNAGWSGGSSKGTSVLLSSAAASHSNYAAPDGGAQAAADDIHAGSSATTCGGCGGGGYSSSSSALSFSAAAAHKLDQQQQQQARKQKTATRPRQAGGGEITERNSENKHQAAEHLVVIHSSPSSSSSSLDLGQPNLTTSSGGHIKVDKEAKITTKRGAINSNISSKVNEEEEKEEEDETESDQRYNFAAAAASAMRQRDSSHDNDINRQQNSSYYYNAAPHWISGAGGGSISGARDEPTTTTTMTANYQSPRPPRQQQIEDDYHLYQVVVPGEQQQLEMATSPCRSIQRIVQSLFNSGNNNNNNNQCDHQPPQPSAISTIDQNLVSSEPLIRSSSWQNKTLIDLSRQSSQQQQQQPRYARFPPTDQQQRESEHLYCGLNTLNNRSQHPNAVAAAANCCRQSTAFQTLALDKQRHFYHQVQMAPGGHQQQHAAYPFVGARSAPLVPGQFAAAAAAVAPPAAGSGSSFSSDSALGFSLSSSSAAAAAKGKLRARGGANGKGQSGACSRFWLVIMLLFGACALALLALVFSSRPSFPQAPSGSGGQPGENKANEQTLRDLYRATGLVVGHQNELLFKPNQNLQQMNHPYRVPPPPPPPPPSIPPLDAGTLGHVAPPGGAVLQFNKVNPVLLLESTRDQDEQARTQVYPPTTTISSATTTTSEQQQLPVSTQSYWLRNNDNHHQARDWCAPNGNECNLRGHCDRGQCYCFTGFSGPTCAKANCPNDCSQRGECKLRTDRTLTNLGALASSSQQSDQLYSRASLQSLAYETLTGSLALNSICPSKLDSEVNQTWAIRHLPQPSGGHDDRHFAYDNRLEWQCSCEAGFTGSDCSQLQEMRCDDQMDDDQDGLIDCEDDDCCSQPVCRDNLMCLKSPEPVRVLELLSSSSPTSKDIGDHDLTTTTFFSRVKFLIANESVQSYAQERAFDKSRVAVIRGKVTKWSPSASTSTSTSGHDDNNRGSLVDRTTKSNDGIVSVRVGVVESSAQFGFTLTRNDGYFDMLVNGNEWITLQFHRNAYAPTKRKVFVRALSINTLDEDVEMVLLGGSTTAASQHQQQQQHQHSSLESTFGSTLSTEIYRLTSLLRRDDERKRNALFECLIDGVQQRAASFKIVHEPTIVQQQRDTDLPLLRTIVPVNQDAFQTEFNLNNLNNQTNPSGSLRIVYNSATFPPSSSVVKSVITIKLLDDDDQSQTILNSLEAVHVRLDIEGQSRREQLQPVANLNYQFAWNRRNVYDQKVYGYAELLVRIGYQYKRQQPKQQRQQPLEVWRECASSIGEPPLLEQQAGFLDKLKQSLWWNPELESRQQLVWFERKIYLEAHQLNQLADVGKWNLAQSNRLHLERKAVYFGSGWSLPYQLVCPPTLSDPISLVAATTTTPSYTPMPVVPASSGQLLPHDYHQSQRHDYDAPSGGGFRTLARGPNSSMFVIVVQNHTLSSTTNRLVQLDASGKRRLIDVPLSSITSRMDQTAANEPHEAASGGAGGPDDFQLIYNNYISTLYVGSMRAAKIVQVSYSSLLVLNKTGPADGGVSSSSELSPVGVGPSSLASEDELVDIEPLCGFGRQLLSSASRLESVRSLRQTRLLGPHSMTLDEQRQVLYFIDGSTHLVALHLHSRHATLLYPSTHQQQQQQRPPSWSWQTPGGKAPLSAGGGSCPSPMRFAYAEFKPHNMHSLTWVQSESSLYFVDQNTVLALRQDYSLEVVAAGPQSAWPASCFLGDQADDQYQLGLIKSLALDESMGELLLVHQWISDANKQHQYQKSKGRFYLAKLRLGIGDEAPIRRRHLFDLHSASQTWDQMVLALSRPAIAPNRSGPTTTTTTAANNRAAINWQTLASDSSRPTTQGASSGQQAKIGPFLHTIAGGFKAVDSIEINSDGSIFVLDSGANQIRLLEPYSPPATTTTASSGTSQEDATANAERLDVNINRLFAGQATRIIGFVNPVSGELMEFHADTGIQLSLTSAPTSATAAGNKVAETTTLAHKDGAHFRMDFYYKIFANNKVVDLDEDDKNDLDIQRLVINYMASSSNSGSGNPNDGQQFDQSAGRQYVRLDKIVVVQATAAATAAGGLDSRGSRNNLQQPTETKTTIELVRSFTGSRFVLQSIISSSSPAAAATTFNPPGRRTTATTTTLCEATNDYLGVLISFRLANKNYWTELIYDGMTYLIRDLVSKKEPALLLLSDTTYANRQRPTTNDFGSAPSSIQQQQGSWTRLKRIVYDRVFFHYCDLFVVDA